MKKLCWMLMLIISWIEFCVGSTQEIDRLLAAVNGKVITTLDLKLTRTLNAVLDLGQTTQMESEKEQLGRLIDQELIRQEMEVYSISQAQVDEEVEKRLEGLRRSYAEIGGLPALLRQLGLEPNELTARVKTIILSEKFVALRFGPFVSVTPEEVESYYRLRLLPDLKARGIPVLPLTEVASRIESLLKEEKKNRDFLEWMDNIKKTSRIEYFDSATDTGTKKQP